MDADKERGAGAGVALGVAPARQIRPLRHPWRWVSAVAVLYLVGALLVSLATNERVGWDIVGEYLFSDSILLGLQRTLMLTAAAMTIGIVLGVTLAVMRMSKNPVLSWTAAAYAWLFRGTPLLVQLIFWYNISAIYPVISIDVPFGPPLFEADANVVIGLWTAALLGLGFNEAAYLSEIFRGGLLAVNKGQTEAAQAVGMTQGLVLRRIVLPQALRVVVPPLGNQFIGMLKITSLVSVIALPELLYSAQLIYSQNFQTIPLLIVVSIWYLAITSVLSFGQYFLEKNFGRGFAEQRTRRTRGVRGEPGEPDTDSGVASVMDTGVPTDGSPVSGGR